MWRLNLHSKKERQEKGRDPDPPEAARVEKEGPEQWERRGRKVRHVLVEYWWLQE